MYIYLFIIRSSIVWSDSGIVRSGMFPRDDYTAIESYSLIAALTADRIGAEFLRTGLADCNNTRSGTNAADRAATLSYGSVTERVHFYLSQPVQIS